MAVRRRAVAAVYGRYGRDVVIPDLDFSVVRETDRGVEVFVVVGQADLHTAPELRSSITAAIDDGARRIVVDLVGTTFIDSMALGVLLGALKRLKPESGQLIVACPEGHVRRVFELTSLDRVLTMSTTRAEAVALLSTGDRVR